MLLIQAPFITYPRTEEVTPRTADKTVFVKGVRKKCNCDALLGMSVFNSVFCLLPFNRNIKIVIKSDVYELLLLSPVKPGLGNYCAIVHRINFLLSNLL